MLQFSMLMMYEVTLAVCDGITDYIGNQPISKDIEIDANSNNNRASLANLQLFILYFPKLCKRGCTKKSQKIFAAASSLTYAKLILRPQNETASSLLCIGWNNL